MIWRKSSTGIELSLSRRIGSSVRSIRNGSPVGAGPGDPELLTRKAERLIGQATILFYDALVGEGVLELAAPGARLVHVGKRSGRHSKDQKTIDALIVEAALAGERVVRLKGGDPSIFGRSTEELDACRAAGVPVHVCPGVTAASAAAAPTVSARLIAAGLAADTPVVMVESASLPDERHFSTRLDLLPIAARAALGDGPAVILVGRSLTALDPAARQRIAASIAEPR
jgi:uroporphyrin-III C-methyltransferase